MKTKCLGSGLKPDKDKCPYCHRLVRLRRDGLQWAPAPWDPYRPRGVYLIHFLTPYEHAKHYVGFSGNIRERLLLHRMGNGARLMAVIQEAGIDFVLVRTWPGEDRSKERRLKRSGGASRYCPICMGRPIRTGNYGRILR